MFRILMVIGLALFLPGAFALGYSIYEGPSAWLVDSRTFWGTPISLFVFWIGLAHAGTLLSAIFLALGIKLDRRTAMIAELSTLSSLAFAAVFPLMHLGIIENFYMVVPFLDARQNFANVRSPLVWDFCCIAVYAVLSLLFFVTHLKSRNIPELEKLRKPMAWLLFPLVLWVHTVVSLDFAVTFVPEWRGAFFPVYFIAGAIFSGIALVNLLLCAEGYRVRLLERLQLIFSWFMCAVWVWDFMLKGSFCTSAFVFAGVLPQLRMVSFVRENKWGRIALSLSVLLGLFLERLFLVSPEFGSPVSNGFGSVDLGLVAFSVGGFMLLFFGVRRYLNRGMEGDGSYFGEVDGSDMAMIEEAAREASEKSREKKRGLDLSYIQPWSSEEYRMLRFPLLIGFAVMLLYVALIWDRLPFENVELTLANMVPLLYPIVALVTSLALYAKYYFVENKGEKSRVGFVGGAIVLILLGFIFGAFWAGGASELSAQKWDAEPLAVENPVAHYIREMGGSGAAYVDSVDLSHARLVWNARCASCHGVDGRFNEKFVREYYPVPQKLNVTRIDSLGIDSLSYVILNGRVNMNAYAGRLTPAEARGLVQYMRYLAEGAK